MNKAFKIIIGVVICLAIGFLGSIATQGGVNSWYPTIEKPSFNPPNWVFAPVWTTLFILMGIAAGLVWDRMNLRPEAKPALQLFGIQLVLNSLWSFLFFYFQMPGVAFIELIILWVFIFLTMRAFFSLSKPAGWLMLPYFLWVTFAGVLNGSIWYLN